MEVEEFQQSEENLIAQDFFPSAFKKQDITKSPAFNTWKNAKIEEGKKIVKCPACFGYEVFVAPTKHQCLCCKEVYCQKCLEKCVRFDRKHNHDKTFCQKLCYVINLVIDYGSSSEWNEPWEYLYTIPLFIFGTPILFTIKYFNFFMENSFIDNDCVQKFFAFLNLLSNAFYSIAYTIIYTEISLILLSPTIIYYRFFKIIIDNWMYVAYELDVGSCPITELTVRGTGYGYH